MRWVRGLIGPSFERGLSVCVDSDVVETRESWYYTCTSLRTPRTVPAKPACSHRSTQDEPKTPEEPPEEPLDPYDFNAGETDLRDGHQHTCFRTRTRACAHARLFHVQPHACFVQNRRECVCVGVLACACSHHVHTRQEPFPRSLAMKI